VEHNAKIIRKQRHMKKIKKDRKIKHGMGKRGFVYPQGTGA